LVKPILAVVVLVGFVGLVRSGGVAHAGAGELLFSQACVTGGVTVNFSWTGSDPSARQQWLDLSTQDNGWLPATYVSAGPLGASTSQYQWTGLRPNTIHYVRVNQQLSNGVWDASPTFQVATGACQPAPSALRDDLPAYATYLTDAQLASHVYPPEVVDNFMRSCTSSSAGMRSTCMCTIEALQRLYMLREFALLEKDVFSTDPATYRAVVAKINAVVDSCR
jgi:hypothetical protein